MLSRSIASLSLTTLLVAASACVITSTDDDKGAGGSSSTTSTSTSTSGSGGDPTGSTTTTSTGAGGNGTGGNGTGGNGTGGGTDDRPSPPGEHPDCSHVWIPSADLVWANAVVGKSSEYGATGWSASQALGKPDFVHADGYELYGDDPRAWSPATPVDGEWIEVSFPEQTLVPYSVEVFSPLGNDGIKAIEVTYSDGSTEKVSSQPVQLEACAFSHSAVLYNENQLNVTKAKITVDQVIVGTWVTIDGIAVHVN